MFMVDLQSDEFTNAALLPVDPALFCVDRQMADYSRSMQRLVIAKTCKSAA
jgi:hypothetical protein